MSVFESLLNNDFAVSRRRRTPDGRGGWVIDYVSIGTVRGRLRPVASRSSRERVEAQQQSREITHVLYVVAGENIKRGDRVTLNSLVVDVEAVREPSRAGEHLEIDCREIQQEQTLEEGS
jgi:SPP1 family predicted phage head-tail adaptor